MAKHNWLCSKCILNFLFIMLPSFISVQGFVMNTARPAARVIQSFQNIQSQGIPVGMAEKNEVVNRRKNLQASNFILDWKWNHSPETIQVITDIDDTVKSSGGVKLAGVALGGIDTQYRRGKFYPGVFQFELELATKSQTTLDPLPVAVLTARAKELEWAIALKPTDKVVKEFQRCGAREGYHSWGIGTVLYGSVREWIFQHLKGSRKFKNFEILKNQQSEKDANIRYIFVGDTGEMDENAGEKMLLRYPNQMKALFLHVVSERNQNIVIPEDKYINGVPVLFFRTYVGAATKAFQYGLINRSALQRVIIQAEKDLEDDSVPISSTKWLDIFKDKVQAESVMKMGLTKRPRMPVY